MKTITTLTAVAALALGMSIAAAQTPSTDKSQTSDKASGTQMDMKSAPKAGTTGANTSDTGMKKKNKSVEKSPQDNMKGSTSGANPSSK